MTEHPEPLAEAAERLAHQVEALGHRVTASRRQVRVLRALTAAVAAIAVGAVVVGTFAVVGWQRADEAIDANRAIQTTSCENANESRAANRLLWGFVVDVSIASSNPDTPPAEVREERRLLEQIRAWVNELYATRDCSDLSRKYPLPDPPPVIDALRGR